MKKVLPFVGLVALSFYFLLRLPSAGAAQLIEVPGQLQGLILIGLEIVVVFALTQIAKLGLDFSGYRSQIVAALFGAVMVFLNAILAKVPPTLEGLVAALINLLVVVLGSFGLYKVYVSFRAYRAR